jgi:hypothetical protein
MGVDVSENPCWVRRATNKTKLGKEARLGKAGDSFENIAEKKSVPWE